MTQYPRYQPDLSGKAPGEVGDANRYVIVLGSDPLQPVIAHWSNGQANHMTYATSAGATKAQRAVQWATTWGDEVRVYDKKLGTVR